MRRPLLSLRPTCAIPFPSASLLPSSRGSHLLCHDERRGCRATSPHPPVERTTSFRPPLWGLGLIMGEKKLSWVHLPLSQPTHAQMPRPERERGRERVASHRSLGHGHGPKRRGLDGRRCGAGISRGKGKSKNPWMDRRGKQDPYESVPQPSGWCTGVVDTTTPPTSPTMSHVWRRHEVPAANLRAVGGKTGHLPSKHLPVHLRACHLLEANQRSQENEERRRRRLSKPTAQEQSVPRPRRVPTSETSISWTSGRDLRMVQHVERKQNLRWMQDEEILQQTTPNRTLEAWTQTSMQGWKTETRCKHPHRSIPALERMGTRRGTRNQP